LGHYQGQLPSNDYNSNLRRLHAARDYIWSHCFASQGWGVAQANNLVFHYIIECGIQSVRKSFTAASTICANGDH